METDFGAQGAAVAESDHDAVASTSDDVGVGEDDAWRDG